MKKFLLVVFIGLVLAINIYGVIEKLQDDSVKPIDPIAESTTTVFME